MLGRRPQDDGDIGDPAASGRDGHALPRLYVAAEFQPGQLGMNLVGNVRHPRPGELLTNAKNLGKVGHKCVTSGVEIAWTTHILSLFLKCSWE